MKRCEFFIIYNTDTGETVFKTKGYMFQKSGHWFTVRRRTDDEKLYRKKWIISDLVTGLIMTDTDSSLKYIQSAVTETMVARLLELYRNNTVSIFSNRSIREELQQYAEMIYRGTYKNDPNSNMLDLLQSQSYELYN